MNSSIFRPAPATGAAPRCLLLLAGLLLLSTAGVAGAESAVDPLAPGDALWRQGKFQEAAASYRAAWEKDPLLLEGHRRFQDSMRRAGAGAEAETLYEERVSAEGSAINLYLQGRATSDARGASKLLKKAIGLAPSFWRARACLASVQVEMGKTKEALKEASRAVEAAPEESEPLRVRGRVLELLGRADDARADFEKAIGLEPENADVHACLGFALTTAGETDAAIEAFGRAVELDPVALAPVCTLAQLEHTMHLEGRGRSDSEGDEPREEGEDPASGTAASSPGVKRIRAALEVLPDEPELHYVLGVLLSDDPGARGEAEAELLSAIEAREGEVDYLCAASGLYLDMEKPSKANEMALAAVKADRKNPEAYRALGVSYTALEDFGKAASALGMASKLLPRDADLSFLLGDCYDRAKEFKPAIVAFERAAALNPGDPEPHLRMGVIYETERSDRKNALACYRRYVELGGSNAKVKEWIADLEK